METKLNAEKCGRVKSRLKYDGCFMVEPVRRKGGLALMWDGEFNVEVLNYSLRHISVWVIDVVGKKKWLLIGFYGEPEANKREEAWRLLADLKPEGNIGWCVIGDFNEILSQDEKIGGCLRQERLMDSFREALESGGLFDLGWRGDKYTWSSKRGWKGSRQFIYEASWALEEDCEGVLKKAWNFQRLNRTNLLEVQSFMESSRGALSRWSRHLEVERGKKLGEKTKRLKWLQAEENGNNAGYIKKIQEIGVLLDKEDLKWRQRAKRNWYQFGDRNTKFFHACASQRRKKNQITQVIDDQNHSFTRPEEVEGAFRSYFENIFTSSQPNTEDIEDCLRDLESRVTSGMNEKLTRAYNRIEVEEMLANRLKSVLTDIISPNQSAFMPERLITDNIMVAYEVMHSMKVRKKGGQRNMAIKIDMSKAYDRIEWVFLEKIMRKMGFNSKCIDMIMKCVSIVSYSILLNGKPGQKIFPSRGLRQGDPLSPYLFILCAEGLSSMLNSSDREGDTRGVAVVRGGTRVNHLLFADDCMLFGRARLDEWLKIQRILSRYEKASGKFLNRDKTTIFFSSNTKTEDKRDVLAAGRATVRGNFERYLGLPTMVGRPKYNTFKCIKERVWQRINNWKNGYLSSAGKEILIKAVLQAIPTYTMSVFKLPKRLC
ncbi:uncharacterized protein LOC122289285 [Carya illinoinensis]|uniref:uncharacterized protein LOC122289285 n=1 Tax=Carya illinoinensis TaxID=32201 RepID=UPI001C71C36F|nr:uncharacterized protein LOC122289285 [Carya illinoinensis]